MKSLISYSFLAALAATGLALGETATTKPVGYITATIGANVSNSPAGAVTFVAPSLVAPASFNGVATVSPSGGTTITFAGGVPTGLNSTSLLEISDGTNEGWWSAIASSNATQIIVGDTFPAGLAANVKVTVRKFSTFLDVFGVNSPGIAPYSSSATYDEIQVLNPITQAASVIVFYNGAWFDLGSESPANDLIIYPGTAVKVVHRANTSLPVIESGEVKLTKTQVDVYPSDNWLGQPNPTGGTFGTMQLGSQITSSDQINIINPDTGAGQSADGFVAFNGTIYNLVDESDATSKPVAEGKGYILKRSSGPSSTVTIPAQVVAP